MPDLCGKLCTSLMAVCLLFIAIATAKKTEANPPAAMPEQRIDWPQFMAGHDLVWQRLPTKWEESPFLGNGLLGTMIYQDQGEALPNRNRRLRFDVQHAGVVDRRPGGDGKFNHARLPVGYFTIETPDEITGCDWRLDLWNAELHGSLTTRAGSYRLRCIILSEKQLFHLTIESADQASAGKNVSITFTPAQAISPRAKWVKPDQLPKGYLDRPAPDPEQTEQDGYGICRQRLVDAGEHATAWRIDASSGKQQLWATVVASQEDNKAVETAIAQIEEYRQAGMASLVGQHQAWWHDYYRRSFVSVADDFWQSFYWIQMYKLGGATRSEHYVIDNHGPWLEPTRWPYATWNLNVQLSYWPYYGSNHCREAESLPKRLSAGRGQLRLNAQPQIDAFGASDEPIYAIDRAVGTGLEAPVNPMGQRRVPPEAGNLPWALHDVWLHYRHTMDETLLRETLFPLLKGAVNYYRTALEEGPDGKLHLPVTYSPEYDSAPDCNYDLALLQWSCQTLLAANQRLNLSDPLESEWQRILDKLIDYPGNDEQGYYIGKDMPYSRSHRHYSHLLMIYPLAMVTPDTEPGRLVIEKSLQHWQSLPRQLQGYSLTGAASFYAFLGDGDKALEKLNGLKGRFLQPNTMYREAGPVIETPLSGAQSMLDMLVQSWGNCLRIFPAIPASWGDVAIDRLLTQGAFEVSAVRKNGQTEWVSITSLAGEPVQLRTGIDGKQEFMVRGSDGKVIKAAGKRVQAVANQPGLLELRLLKGESVLFTRASLKAKAIVEPVQRGTNSHFGLFKE